MLFKGIIMVVLMIHVSANPLKTDSVMDILNNNKKYDLGQDNILYSQDSIRKKVSNRESFLGSVPGLLSSSSSKMIDSSRDFFMHMQYRVEGDEFTPSFDSLHNNLIFRQRCTTHCSSARKSMRIDHQILSTSGFMALLITGAF